MNDVSFRADDGISALADGALTGSTRAQAVHRVLSSAEGLQTWHVYHVIGDVLRSPELATGGDDHAFCERLSQKIAIEPKPPRYDPAHTVLQVASAHSVDTLAPVASANAAVWRWKLLAGVACAACGGLLGLALWGAPSSPAQMAVSDIQRPVITVVDGRNGPMLRDPHLDRLIAAHQQVGGHSALQMPAGFLRNATVEGVER